VFLLGLFYIYIWVMVRTLFLMMGRVDYIGNTTILVPILVRIFRRKREVR
jgi:hypothetical protein